MQAPRRRSHGQVVAPQRPAGCPATSTRPVSWCTAWCRGERPLALPRRGRWLTQRRQATPARSLVTPDPLFDSVSADNRAENTKKTPKRGATYGDTNCTNRALRRLTSEVRRDPVYSTRYGRQRRCAFFFYSILPLIALLHRRERQGKKNCLHFSICACHPCAGAMLIFSAPDQVPPPTFSHFCRVANRICWPRQSGGSGKHARARARGQF